MTDAEVIALEAHRLSNFITEAWLASQSDSGAVWDRASKALIAETAKHPPEVIVEAHRLAHERWDRWINEVNNDRA